MKRRTFVRSLLGWLGVGITAGPAASLAAERRLVIQESPLAGFQHHQGSHVWSFLAEGDPLRLVREAANPHDGNAVAVYFKGAKLGYVPGRENAVVAQLLDRGHRLDARIVRLREDPNPWRRLRFGVELRTV